MSANIPNSAEDLKEALDCIRHDDPQWWLPKGVFEKLGTIFKLDAQVMAEEAKKTGWKPKHPDLDPHDESAMVHHALQHLGIGIGHHLYDDMMRTFNAGDLKYMTKQNVVDKYGLGKLPGNMVKGTTFADLVAVAMLVHIARDDYVRSGNKQMKEREKNDKRVLNDKYNQKLIQLLADKDEERAIRSKLEVPPKRTLPWHGWEDYLRRKAEQEKALQGDASGGPGGADQPLPTPPKRGRDDGREGSPELGEGPPSKRRSGPQSIHVSQLEAFTNKLTSVGRQYFAVGEILLFVNGNSVASIADNEDDQY
ncbi:hypothetical protein J7T55_013096 [Diaporthe amygdali]|uniref:uncharacterized protein n=1 Tax=Phomopsis amygdali TaxID=1214568 RepID=UPI0022FE09F9|nr:uncharacterized protein J7T55_013096 [Diaporthe amygdali]KAJ0118840.1 hypothetical protein J7T55_013096 [Diaporthe amygdali]